MDVVRGYLHQYDWGASDGLAQWAGESAGPQAELWFGTHPNGPSPRLDGAATDGVPMPILTKLLAAGRPLSIQIHPPEEIARRQFAKQQQDPDAPALLADDLGKAEILIAIEPFDILEGFRDPAEAAEVFTHLGPALRPAGQALRAGDIAEAIRLLLALPDEDVADNAPNLPAAMRAAGMTAHSARIMASVVECFPGDPGVFVASLLRARTLAPGQAIYVDPGTVHAYVRGMGLEVMNSSDNVLRLGLTHKPIAVDEALAAVSMQAQPHPCEPEQVDGVRTYAPSGAPFSVRLLSATSGVAEQGVARTVLCLSGTAAVGSVVLKPGEAVLARADEPSLDVRAEGDCVIAQQAPGLDGQTG